MLKLSGYTPVFVDFSEFNPSEDWIAIKEDLKKEISKSGIILIDNKNTNIGVIEKISEKGKTSSGLDVGDTILFTEWMGGKWSFQDETSPTNEIKVIVMELGYVLASIRKE